MASVTKVLFAVFVTTVLSSANGQIYDQPPEPIETEYPVDILFHVNDDGVIRNLTTGLVVTKQQAIASLETPYPILGGIILGGLGGGAVHMVKAVAQGKFYLPLALEELRDTTVLWLRLADGQPWWSTDPHQSALRMLAA